MNPKHCFPFRKWTIRRLPVCGLALGMLAFAAVMLIPAQSNAQTHVISVKAEKDSITAGETASFFLELTNAPGISDWPRHNLKVTWSPPGLVETACGETPTNVATATSHTCTARARFRTNDKVSSPGLFKTFATKLDGSSGWIKVSADTNQSFSGNYTPTYNSAEESATVDVLPAERFVFSGWNKDFDGTVLVTGEPARSYGSYTAEIKVVRTQDESVEFVLESQKNNEQKQASNAVVLSTELTEEADFSIDMGRSSPHDPETIKINLFPSNGNGITGLVPGDTRTYTLIFTVKNSSSEVVETEEVTVVFSNPVQSIDFNGWNNNFNGTLMVTGGSLGSYASYSAQLPVTKTDDATVEFELEVQKNNEQKMKVTSSVVALSTNPTRVTDFVVSFGSGNQQSLERINIGFNPSLGIGIFGLNPGDTRTYTLTFTIKNSADRIVETEKVTVLYRFPSESVDEPSPNAPILSISGTGGAVEGETALLFTITAVAAGNVNLSDSLNVNYTVTETGGFLAPTVVKGKQVTKEVNFSGSGNSRTAQLSLQLAPDDPVIRDNGTVTVTLNADSTSGTSYIVSRISGEATQLVYDNDDRDPGLFLSASSESIYEGESVDFFVRVVDRGGADISLPVRVSQQGEFVLWNVPDRVTIPANSRVVRIRVYTDDDRTYEPSNGRITFRLPSVPDGHRLGSEQSLTVQVFDNDTPQTPQTGYSVAGLVIVDIIKAQQSDPMGNLPVISVTAKSTTPIDESAGNAVFTLTSTPAPEQNLTVNLNVMETGNVTTFMPKTVNIPMGQSEVDLNVPLNEDTITEPDSTITVKVESGENYSPAQPSSGNMASLKVDDNDLIRVSVKAKSTAGIEESDRNAVFTLTATPPPSENLTVNIKVSETGSVIDTKPPTVEIPMGQSEVDFDVPLDDDNVNEADSKITVEIVSDGTNYATNGTNNAGLTVLDNDQIKITGISVGQDKDSRRPECDNSQNAIEGCPIKVEVTLGDNTGITWTRTRLLTVNFAIGGSMTTIPNKIGNTVVQLSPQSITSGKGKISSLETSCNSEQELAGNNNFSLFAYLIDGNGYTVSPAATVSSTLSIFNVRPALTDTCPTGSATDITDNGALKILPMVSANIPTGPIPNNAGPIIIEVTSNPAPIFDMQVNFNVQQSGDVVMGDIMSTVTVPKGQTTAQLLIPLNEDSNEGGILINLIDGAYNHASDIPKIITITDAAASGSPPRSQETAKASRVLNQEILPDLLASTSGQSMDTVSERIDFAFDSPGQTLLELNGSSSPSDLISRAGEMANNGDLSWENIRNGSSFAVPLTLDGTRTPMTFWGSGFGKEVSNDANSRFDWKGETAMGHLGLDATLGQGLLVGMVASSEDSSVDFELNRHFGTYDVRMTNFNPYLAWSSQDLSTRLKFSAGYGVGEIEIDYEDQSPETAESHQHSVLLGISDQLASLQNASGYRAGLELDTEFRLARQFVESNGEGITGTAVGNRSLSASLEGTLEKSLASGSVLSPFATASTKWKGGSDEAGAELDLTSGMEFTSLSGVRISGSNYIQLIGESDMKHELECTLEFDSGNDRTGILLDSSFAYQPIDGYLSRSMGFGYGFNPDSRIRLGLSKGDISSTIKLNSLVQW